MFGHEAGAFTGASKRRIGKVEYGSGGTLFLDEIESMPLALLAKLLRVLQERVVERLGGNVAVPVDCRVRAATKEKRAELLRLPKKRLYDKLARHGIAADTQRSRARLGDWP